MRILIVEDDDKTANYLTRGLSESGYIVDRANDGDTGLTQTLEGIYDFLIVDKRLPGVDGLELVRRLRERELTLPILMISGLASIADRVEGLQAGCDDYLGKPYAFSELLARIEANEWWRHGHDHRRNPRVRDLFMLWMEEPRGLAWIELVSPDAQAWLLGWMD